MPEKYKVTVNGKVRFEGWAKDENEAKLNASIKEGEDAKVEVTTPKHLTTDFPEELPKKGRKSRSDIGGKHSKAEPKKRRTMYHLIEGPEFKITNFESKEALDKALDNLSSVSLPLGQYKVIEGGSVHLVECQKSWKLK